MTEPYAEAVEAIAHLDSTIAGVRSEWVDHYRRCNVLCEEYRNGAAELDKLLDRRIAFMAYRDSERLWIDSGGPDDGLVL